MVETTHQSPLIVAVGGLDSSGGAGLIRDYLTGRDLGSEVCLISTAWTLQTENGVPGIDAREADRLQQDLKHALAAAQGRAVAVKLGLVAAEAQVPALLDALQGFTGPVVFDPVLAASRGGSLYLGDPRRLLPLIRRSTLATPNLAEAAALAEQPVAILDGARKAAHELVDRGVPAVLVKGGHFVGSANDLLVWRQDPEQRRERIFPASRLPGPSPRGTGCSLATAIAVGLARGQPLEAAVLEAKTWVYSRIAAARDIAGERHLWRRLDNAWIARTRHRRVRTGSGSQSSSKSALLASLPASMTFRRVSASTCSRGYGFL